MYTVTELRALGRRPRVHPNGFIQFDIEPKKIRLNVWPAEPLPVLRSRCHPIHNHSFDLHSRIICGALINSTYIFIPTSGYGWRRDRDRVTTVMYRAERVEGTQNDSVLRPLHNGYGRLVSWTSTIYGPGEEYALLREILHDSLPHGLTATLMEMKMPDVVYGPLIAVPLGVEPNNEFRRENHDEEVLWQIIDKALVTAAEIEARPLLSPKAVDDWRAPTGLTHGL